MIGCQFHPELSGAYGEALLSRVPGARLMLTSRIIPCLDVSHGRVVKGVRSRACATPATRPSGRGSTRTPGGDEIVILDVSATPEGRGHQHETVRRVREVLSIPLTVGGGVRAVDDAWHLLEAGADKVSVNTAAVERPELLTEIAERFGRQCCVLAIDAAMRDGRFEVLVKGGREGTGIDALDWAREAERRGAGEILLTSLGPRRHPLGLRPGADPGGGAGGARAGDRLGRCRFGRAHPRGVRGRRRRGARGLDLPRRRHHPGRHQALSAGARHPGAAVIVPSIDLQGGQTVQLVGGAEKAIDAGDPRPIAERFALAGEIAVIDLDAAMRTGSNAALIEGLLPRFACRVGGGIRDVATRDRAGSTRVRARSSSARRPSPRSCRSCRASG